MVKYEVMLLETVPPFANGKLKKLQNKGWAIAGNIEVRYSEQSNGAFMYIPLKKKINK